MALISELVFAYLSIQCSSGLIRDCLMYSRIWLLMSDRQWYAWAKCTAIIRHGTSNFVSETCRSRYFMFWDFVFNSRYMSIKTLVNIVWLTLVNIDWLLQHIVLNIQHNSRLQKMINLYLDTMPKWLSHNRLNATYILINQYFSRLKFVDIICQTENQHWLVCKDMYV